MSNSHEEPPFDPFAHEPLQNVPPEWEQFADAVGLRRVGLQGEEGEWWITLYPSPDVTFAGPPYQSESFAYHSRSSIPSPSFIFGSKLGSLVASSHNRGDAGWQFARIPTVVLLTAQKGGDDLATPASLGNLIDALLDRAHLLTSLVLEARASWAKDVGAIVGETPNLIEDSTKVSAYGSIVGHSIPTLVPSLTKEWLDRHQPNDRTKAQLLQSFEEHPFRLNELLAKMLEKIGPRGESLAKNLRERQQNYRENPNPYHRWIPWVRLLSGKGAPGPPAIRWLCEAVWYDVVRPKVERANRKQPALAMVVYQSVANLLSRARRDEERSGQRVLALADDVLVKVHSVEAGVLESLVDTGIKLFGSVNAHRVMRWQIRTAHAQALSGDPDPRVLRVPGGYAALAHEHLGLKGEKATKQIQAIIEAEHAVEIPLPPQGDYSRLLLRRFTPARGRRQSYLEIVLGTALLPDYVHELRRSMGYGHDARRAIRLVPVLDLPPFIGNNEEHGPQAAFSMLVVGHLRDHARELVEQGGVVFDEATLARLATQAGLGPHRVKAVLDRWTQDGPDGSAVLKKVGRGRYTLGDSHSLERAFIEEGGRAELDGAKAGAKGAKNRRATVQRLAGSGRKQTPK